MGGDSKVLFVSTFFEIATGVLSFIKEEKGITT
jgi:hypothetical protein